MAITTKAALADELGITRARVSQYVKAGLPVRADGKLNRQDALNWLNTYTKGVIGSDKGSSRARRLVREDGRAPTKRPSAASQGPMPAVDHDNLFDIAARMAVLTLLRPHADIIAAAVLEAGGSLEVAFTAAHLAHSPLIEAAGLTLQAMHHPGFQEGEHDLRVPRDWQLEPEWKAYAAKAGVPFDPEALRRHLDANPVWSATFDEDHRRFQRDLTLADVTGSGGAGG